MRRLAIAIVCFVVSCSDDDPRYGDPSAIKGKQLPDSPKLDFFPTAYDATKPTPAGALARHKAVNQVAPTPDLACMGCHSDGTAGATRALFAGWIGGRRLNVPAKLADVVVIDAEGRRYEAKTDDDGFFWFPDDGKGTRQLFVAVRDADGNEIRMPPGFASGGCTAQACHGQAASAGYALLP